MTRKKINSPRGRKKRKLTFFFVNTKNISSHVLKISDISLLLRTREFYFYSMKYIWYSVIITSKKGNILYKPGLEKSSVLPVLDRFLKLKTDLFLDKKLKNRSIKRFWTDFWNWKPMYFSRFCNTQTDMVTCQNCSHLIIRCYLS